MKSVTCMKQRARREHHAHPPAQQTEKQGQRPTRAHLHVPRAQERFHALNQSNGHICSSNQTDSSKGQQQRERGQIIATLPHGMDFTHSWWPSLALSQNQQPAPRARQSGHTLAFVAVIRQSSDLSQAVNALSEQAQMGSLPMCTVHITINKQADSPTSSWACHSRPRKDERAHRR